MIKILTDSTADMPPSLQENPRIEIIPLKVVTPEATYLDRIDLNTKQFLELLARSEVLPTTSQPSAGEFEAKYREMLAGGASEILSIHLSSKLSGTIASTYTALESMPGAPITVFDTLTTSIGLGIMLWRAVAALDAGKSVPEVVSLLEIMRDGMTIGLVVDTLEYLYKGGRIGKATALMGSLLNVKPVLALANGVIEPLDKARSKRKAIARAMDYVESRVGTERPIGVGIAQLEALEDAKAVEKEMRARFNCCEVFIAELSPVLSTHVGPGTIGIAGCPLP